MRFTNKFPYTNINNINLDWIIKRVKELGETVRSYANDIANAVALAEAAQDAADSVTGTAESAVATAQAAEATANAIAGTANSALSTAQAANNTAQAAEATANAIAGTANSALSTAQAANATAQAANATAQAAEESADNAETIAGTASANASNAVQTANTALATAQTALTIASQFDESVLNEKAGSLIATESGEIASFVPDRTIEQNLSVSVAVEPLQSGTGTPAPDNVRPISGCDEVRIWAAGKDLGESATLEVGSWSESKPAGTPYDEMKTTTTNSRARCRDLIPINGKVKLTGNFNSYWVCISLFDENGLFLGRDSGFYNWVTTPEGIEITNPNAYYIAVAFRKPDSTGFDYNDIVLHIYTLFNTYTVTIGQTVYGGTLDATNGIMTVEWGMYTYNGSEYGWNTSPASQYGVSYFRNTGFYNDWAAAILPGEAVVNNFFKSNMGLLHDYKWIDGNAVTPGQYGLAIGYGLRAALNGLTPDDITLEEWKTWLSSNPIQLAAKLKNPITITLDPVTIAAISEQTNNVWSDAGNVTAEFAADLKWYIDKEIAEVQALALENGG